MAQELPYKFQIDANRLGVEDSAIDGFANILQSHIQALAPVSKAYPGHEGGRGRDSIKVEQGVGQTLVITMGERYMHYLNRGFKGFVMYALVGRTVPIRLPGGRIIFRRATSTNVGQRRITARDKRTGQIMAGNRGIRWYHPGVPAMRFVERGIESAMPVIATMYGKLVLARFFDEYKRLTESQVLWGRK